MDTSPPRSSLTGDPPAARHAGQAVAATGIATLSSHPASSGSTSAPSGRGLVQERQQSVRRPGGRQHPGRQPDGRRGRRDQRSLEPVREHDVAALGAERAAHPDRPQPSLHLGPRGGAEHHPGGHQRDQRQRDQQVDHDSGRLVEQDPDPGTRGESGCRRRPKLVERACTSTWFRYRGSRSQISARFTRGSGSGPKRASIAARDT